MYPNLFMVPFSLSPPLELINSLFQGEIPGEVEWSLQQGENINHLDSSALI